MLRREFIFSNKSANLANKVTKQIEQCVLMYESDVVLVELCAERAIAVWNIQVSDCLDCATVPGVHHLL